MKTERERLIDLLDYQEVARFCNMCHDCPEMRAASLIALADHLIANGVRLPPVKVGATVYRIGEEICKHCALCNDWCSGHDKKCGNYNGVREIEKTPFNLNMLDEIGKTVFITLDEAKKALTEDNE